jgi:hypothetical protein
VVVSAVLVGSVGSLLAAAPVSAWVAPPAAPVGVLAALSEGSAAVSGAAGGLFGGRGAVGVVERGGGVPRGDEGVAFDGPGVVGAQRPVTGVMARTSVDVGGSRAGSGPVGVVQRTAVSEVVANGDGTETVRSWSSPRFFEARPGVWEPVDNTVVADGTRPGWLVNRAGGWRFAFGPVSGDGSAGGVEIVRGSVSVRVAPGFVASGRMVVPRVVDGSPDSVVYRDVLDGVDVVYRVTAVGLKEDVVLRKRPPVASFRSWSRARMWCGARMGCCGSVLGRCRWCRWW